MTVWPNTDSALIHKIADATNHDAWQQFDGLYRPVIYRFARRSGMDHHGADDVAADVMRRIAKTASRWDRERPPEKFAAWLSRVSQNSLLNLVCRELSKRGTGGTTHQISLDQRPAASDEAKQNWENEWHSELVRIAASRIRGDFDEPSWQAFWSTHVEGESIADVAIRLGKSHGAIYAIRSRIIRRLRDEVQLLHSRDVTR